MSGKKREKKETIKTLDEMKRFLGSSKNKTIGEVEVTFNHDDEGCTGCTIKWYESTREY